MPRQTRQVEGVIQPIVKVWKNVWAALWEAQLRGEILFVVRHFETLEGGNWVRMPSGFWDLSLVGWSTCDAINPLTHKADHQGFQSKMAATAKKTDLGLLEEDDEFEEFPAEGMSLSFLIESYSLKIPLSLDNLF